MKKLIRNIIFNLKGSKKYWEKRYSKGGNSGKGSYGNIARKKAEVVNNLIRRYNIKSIIDMGCGDGFQLGLFNIKEYIGLDVSDTIIKKCKNRWIDDDTKRFYLYPNRYKKAQCGLSMEVIFHLIENNVFEQYMKDLFNSSQQYVIIFSDNENKKQTIHEKHRKFTNWINNNLLDWELIETIHKPISESPCSFYVFKKEELE